MRRSHLTPTLTDVVSDTVLSQLNMIFGPMLMSALQLVDRREGRSIKLRPLFICSQSRNHCSPNISKFHRVPLNLVVRVELPAKRHVWQVTSSTGHPYTLYLSLPPLPQGEKENDTITKVEAGETNSTDSTADAEPLTNRSDGKQQEEDQKRANRDYVRALKGSLEGVWCPCTGFAYNTLAAPRNVFVSVFPTPCCPPPYHSSYSLLAHPLHATFLLPVSEGIVRPLLSLQPPACADDLAGTTSYEIKVVSLRSVNIFSRSSLHTRWGGM